MQNTSAEFHLALASHTKEGREQSKLACYAEADAGVRGSL